MYNIVPSQNGILVMFLCMYVRKSILKLVGSLRLKPRSCVSPQLTLGLLLKLSHSTDRQYHIQYIVCISLLQLFIEAIQVK